MCGRNFVSSKTLPGLRFAMNRVGSVDRRHTVTDPVDDLQRDLQVGVCAAPTEPLFERLALDELRRKVGRTVVLAKGIDLQDVRMAHASQRPGLRRETLNEVVAVQVRMDEFDRDASIERFVLREQNDAHRTAAERPEHAVHAVDQRSRLDAK